MVRVNFSSAGLGFGLSLGLVSGKFILEKPALSESALQQFLPRSVQSQGEAEL